MPGPFLVEIFARPLAPPSLPLPFPLDFLGATGREFEGGEKEKKERDEQKKQMPGSADISSGFPVMATSILYRFWLVFQGSAQNCHQRPKARYILQVAPPAACIPPPMYADGDWDDAPSTTPLKCKPAQPSAEAKSAVKSDPRWVRIVASSASSSSAAKSAPPAASAAAKSAAPAAAAVKSSAPSGLRRRCSILPPSVKLLAEDDPDRIHYLRCLADHDSCAQCKWASRKQEWFSKFLVDPERPERGSWLVSKMVGGAIKIGCSSGCTLSGNVRDQTEISPLEPSQDRELFVNILFCFAPPAQFQSLLGCALCKSVGAACSWGQITVGHALCFQSSNLVNHTKAKCHKDVECLTSPKSPNILKKCRTVAPAHISGRSAGNHRTTTCFAI